MSVLEQFSLIDMSVSHDHLDDEALEYDVEEHLLGDIPVDD